MIAYYVTYKSTRSMHFITAKAERVTDSVSYEDGFLMQVQISAYLDNVFDVAALMEDSETKTAALEKVAELEDELAQVRWLWFSHIYGFSGSRNRSVIDFRFYCILGVSSFTRSLCKRLYLNKMYITSIRLTTD